MPVLLPGSMERWGQCVSGTQRVDFIQSLISKREGSFSLLRSTPAALLPTNGKKTHLVLQHNICTHTQRSDCRVLRVLKKKETPTSCQAVQRLSWAPGKSVWAQLIFPLAPLQSYRLENCFQKAKKNSIEQWHSEILKDFDLILRIPDLSMSFGIYLNDQYNLSRFNVLYSNLHEAQQKKIWCNR